MSKYNNTKFYWLQLKEDFFDEDAINWLEEQPNGKEYCLFYLKLCLKSLKTNGIMIRKVGEMLVPYDCKKLAEITKTDVDTVAIAMQLLKQIGLITIMENGELYLTNVENMIGSQSVGAFKKQQQIMRRDNNLVEGGKGVEKIPPEIELELELDIDKEKKVYKEKKVKKVDFLPPTLEQVVEYAKSRNSKIDPKRFYDFYTVGDDTTKHWVDSNGKKVKNWKQKFITWEGHTNTNTDTNTKQSDFIHNNYTKEQLAGLISDLDVEDV